jgi:hypothetical protein
MLQSIGSNFGCIRIVSITRVIIGVRIIRSTVWVYIIGGVIVGADVIVLRGGRVSVKYISV